MHLSFKQFRKEVNGCSFEDSEGKRLKLRILDKEAQAITPNMAKRKEWNDTLKDMVAELLQAQRKDWKDPTTAGALSRWILWNKPSLKASFDDYKSRFGLKGSINVSKSAEERKCKSCEKPATNVVQEGSFCFSCLPINLGC